MAGIQIAASPSSVEPWSTGTVNTPDAPRRDRAGLAQGVSCRGRRTLTLLDIGRCCRYPATLRPQRPLEDAEGGDTAEQAPLFQRVTVLLDEVRDVDAGERIGAGH